MGQPTEHSAAKPVMLSRVEGSRDHPPVVRITDRPDPNDVAWLNRRIIEFNYETTGLGAARELAAFVRDGEDIVGGVYGWTWGGTCEVDLLWVRADRRGTGLGSQLLAAAEREARARGCDQVVLTTHEFQAPDFYRSRGFEELGGVDDYPSGWRHAFLRKRLAR